ncbi:NAD(+) hydrolase sarm1-like isoform X1 [Centruroides vittatus]|uniref:NAD(+) hydrolase sarm1-like isoform X1 n=2 Tax=Centruroides vittatus TaxID=120091 RepID=UPI00350FC2B3
MAGDGDDSSPSEMSDLSLEEHRFLPSNGSISSVVENFNKKSLMNKLNSSSSITSSSAYTSSSEKSQIMKSSSSSSSSVLSKKAQIVQEQNESFHENRNYSRSVSVTSSSSSSTSDSRMKMLTQRGFSVDDSLEEQPQEVKFEQKRVTSAAKVKVTGDNYTSEKMAATNKELKRVQAGDVSYEEKHAAAAIKEVLDMDGISAEKMAAVRQDQKQLKTGDIVQQQQRTAMASAVRMSTDDFSAEKLSMAKQDVFTERNLSSKFIITSKEMRQSSMSSQSDFSGISSLNYNMGSQETFALPTNSKLAIEGVEEDFQILKSPTSVMEVQNVLKRFNNRMYSCIDRLKNATNEEATSLITAIYDIVKRAWAVPNHGNDLGSNMCNILRNTGGLDILINNCTSDNSDLKFSSTQLLEQCFSTENRAYIVENGLEQVVNAACACSTESSVAQSRVGTGILEHLFKHSEATCSDVIRMGGLKAILFDCRTSDIETLRHCATALANLSLYGGPENQQAMIKHKVPVWLFPLAFHQDDNIKYYACLAIAVLVANKEIEAAVLRSGTLDLVEPFVISHSPQEFSKSAVAHILGQSKNWLLRLVPVLNSKREEARSLAAFHFAMEAGIKKKQGNTGVFHEIGAIEALKKVASSPNAIASKFAAQALQLIGEEVPHKLSQQVPLWTVEDVREWVKQIGFSPYCQTFSTSRVDGDLLLQLTESMLRDDIGITNGILRRRFLRELNRLKQMADYTSCDTTNLNQLLQGFGQEFSQYTYQMLHCGVQKDTLRYLTEEQLALDCGVENSIHRLRIGHAIKDLARMTEIEETEADNKCLDVFVSYRRSNGSQLASLLKVHLQLRGFSVFLDVERLEAGKFDNNLLNSIRQAKHFILVLTPSALDRCLGDRDCKDWVHREILEALQSKCNIIPILDNFQWPESETLPDDIRAVCYFNGIRWIHDYQDACVDKLERFMRGDTNYRMDGLVGRNLGVGPGTPGTPSTNISRVPIYNRSSSSDSGEREAQSCSDCSH